MPDRQSRRSVLATIAALPLTGALSACSSSDGASQSGSTSNTSTISNKGAQRATHITFWSALRGGQEVVDAFNRTHDLIQVDFQQIPTGARAVTPSSATRSGRATPRTSPPSSTPRSRASPSTVSLASSPI